MTSAALVLQSYLLNLNITQAPTEFVEVVNIFGSVLAETYEARYPDCF
ncbi:hypothetical protein MPF_0616 [Methanohalophilus portucalensis FDF-1]|nr:hypothetical protein MPF_0616 [Methanohalophilus portucalensis FDF-1]